MNLKSCYQLHRLHIYFLQSILMAPAHSKMIMGFASILYKHGNNYIPDYLEDNVTPKSDKDRVFVLEKLPKC